MNVVVRTEDGAVSLLVDEIGDVVEVEESDAMRRLPDTLTGRWPRTDPRSLQAEGATAAVARHGAGV